MSNGWYGMDLDGTLSHEVSGGLHEIGEPIPAMVKLVKRLRAAGEEVRIFTARIAPPISQKVLLDQIWLINNWCWDNVGEKLPVTCTKDLEMIRCYDDRARQVERNTGRLIGEDDEETEED